MNINYKVVFGSIYVLCLGIFLFFVFSYLDFKDLTNYSYIRDNTKELLDFKNNNYFLLVLLFSIFSIIWIIFLGFGSPLAIVSGFVFGNRNICHEFYTEHPTFYCCLACQIYLTRCVLLG